MSKEIAFPTLLPKDMQRSVLELVRGGNLAERMAHDRGPGAKHSVAHGHHYECRVPCNVYWRERMATVNRAALAKGRSRWGGREWQKAALEHLDRAMHHLGWDYADGSPPLPATNRSSRDVRALRCVLDMGEWSDATEGEMRTRLRRLEDAQRTAIGPVNLRQCPVCHEPFVHAKNKTCSTHCGARHGKGAGHQPRQERLQRILEAHERGERNVDIARAEGVSRERVGQLLKMAKRQARTSS